MWFIDLFLSRHLSTIPPSLSSPPPPLPPSPPSLPLLPLLPPCQCRDPLPLPALKTECCPRISAHDFIVLCGLEAQALGYGSYPWGQEKAEMTRDNPLLQRPPHGGGWRGRGVAVDVRSQEEYPFVSPRRQEGREEKGVFVCVSSSPSTLTRSRFHQGHVPGSLSLPHHQAFQPDGSLTPSPAVTQLMRHRGRPVAVVAKGDTGQVVRAREILDSPSNYVHGVWP